MTSLAGAYPHVAEQYFVDGDTAASSAYCCGSCNGVLGKACRCSWQQSTPGGRLALSLIRPMRRQHKIEFYNILMSHTSRVSAT